MLLIVWLVVGIAALLVVGVLGFGLWGHLGRLRAALRGAQTAVAPQVTALTQGIQRAQALRTSDRTGQVPDREHGTGRHV